MEKINTDYTNDDLEKFRLNFPRCGNRNVLIAYFIHWVLHRYCRSTNYIYCLNEGLTLETSALESLYGGQFTLSTQLIKPNYLVILSTDAAPQFL